jgi:hypothetical protein
MNTSTISLVMFRAFITRAAITAVRDDYCHRIRCRPRRCERPVPERPALHAHCPPTSLGMVGCPLGLRHEGQFRDGCAGPPPSSPRRANHPSSHASVAPFPSAATVPRGHGSILAPNGTVVLRHSGDVPAVTNADYAPGEPLNDGRSNLCRDNPRRPVRRRPEGSPSGSP